MHAMSDWDDLRFFLAIHRAGTLAAAAKALKVDHTTVGRRLRGLESSLNARLYDRRPDGFELTGAGARILEAAHAMEEHFHSLERRALSEDARLEGTVRIAASHTFAAGFLVPSLVAVRARHPGIEIEVVTGPGAYDLPRREADLALRFSKPSQQTLLTRKVADVGFALYASRAYLATRGRPSTADDLTGHDVVGYDREGSFIPGAKWLETHARHARSMVRCDQILSVLAGATAGLGIAVLPCFVAEAESCLVRISSKVVTSDTLHLVVHPEVQRVARVRVMIDLLVELLAAGASKLRGDPPLRSAREQ
jgi:DNA-binding transcriptional LysR family regulator